jgi:hypothetical protein
VLYWCQQEPGGIVEGEWRAKSGKELNEWWDHNKLIFL